MKTLKGVIFPLLMALLTFIPYGMRHYGPVGTYLAPVKPFVFGTSEPSEAGSGRSVLMKGAVRDPLAIAREAYRGSLISAEAYPSEWQKQDGEGDTKEYVNRAHGLSLSCPAGWVEKRPLRDPRQVLRLGPPGEGAYPVLAVTVLPLCLYSLEQSPEVLASLLGSDVKTHYRKACSLKDGTPAYEAELERMEGGREVTTTMVAAMKGSMLVMAHLSHTSGLSEEEMKSILYSLKERHS